MLTTSIDTASIEIGERHRALSEDAVARLAASMKDIGLRSPITVRVVDDYVLPDGEVCDGVPVLVAGAHRLAAAKSLGWSHIDCIDADDDAITAEMWEIAENLHRLDLSKEQRDEHIRRYAELLDARLQSQQNASIESKRIDGRGHRPVGVPRKIAEETGLSVDTVRRALNPKPVLREIRAGQEPIAGPPTEVFEVHEKARKRLMSAWNGATDGDRQWFRDWIDTPVFDNARAA